ncbi:MAG: hypothetical protein NTW04_02670 [Elusimicrobia bacterium]|nr:hypothetical protein [Elusimicrobiota bacterium]
MKAKLINFIKAHFFEIAIFTALLIFFAVLEVIKPHYFLKGRALTETFLALVYNYKSLLGGELAFFNFHQYLGVPWFASGQSVLYPPSYICVFLSEMFFGNYFAALDFLAFFHLFVGGLGFFYFLKAEELNDKSSFFGAIAWMFCGFSVVLTGSWSFTAAATAYFPWMIFFTSRLFQGGRGSFIGLIAVRVLFFYCGSIQLYISCQIFEWIFFLLKFPDAEKNHRWKIARSYIFNNVVSLCFSMPLGLPMFYQFFVSTLGGGGLSYGEFKSGSANVFLWTLGLLAPWFYESLKNFSLSDWFFDKDLRISALLPYFSHLGYLTLAPLFFFIPYSDEKYRRFASRLVLPCIIAFLWAAGILSFAMYYVPGLNKFRYPFMMLFFVNFFLISLCAVKFQNVQQKFSKTMLAVFLTMHVLGFYAVYWISPGKVFGDSGVASLIEPLRDKFSRGRIISLSETPSASANILSRNMATFFGLFHFTGAVSPVPKANASAIGSLNYGPVADFRPSELDYALPYLRDWGVRWYIADSGIADFYKLQFLDLGISIYTADARRTIFYDSSSRPLAYWQDTKKGNGISFKVTANEMIINTSAKTPGGYITANMMHNPFFTAYVDGKRARIFKTEGCRMSAYAPQGAHELVFTYREPMFYLGIVIAVAALVMLIFIKICKI